MQQDGTAPIPFMIMASGCRTDNVVAPVFQYYAQSTQTVPSTKVQALSTTVNTILMTCQLTRDRGLYTGP